LKHVSFETEYIYIKNVHISPEDPMHWSAPHLAQ